LNSTSLERLRAQVLGDGLDGGLGLGQVLLDGLELSLILGSPGGILDLLSTLNGFEGTIGDNLDLLNKVSANIIKRCKVKTTYAQLGGELSTSVTSEGLLQNFSGGLFDGSLVSGLLGGLSSVPSTKDASKFACVVIRKLQDLTELLGLGGGDPHSSVGTGGQASSQIGGGLLGNVVQVLKLLNNGITLDEVIGLTEEEVQKADLAAKINEMRPQIRHRYK